MGVNFADGAVRVRVPATSANLGPGFDAVGLALGLYDDVAAWVTEGGRSVDVVGEGAGELPAGADHLVVRAMDAAFDRLGGRPPGVAVECVNRIPQARGLGSSSAAIVAGIQLARGLVAGGTELMEDDAALALAAEIEGHPDNVAPCLLGGFVIAWAEPASGSSLAAPSGGGGEGPAVRGGLAGSGGGGVGSAVRGGSVASGVGEGSAPGGGSVGSGGGGVGSAVRGGSVASGGVGEDAAPGGGSVGAVGEDAASGGGSARAADAGEVVGGGAVRFRAVRLVPAESVRAVVFVPRRRGLTAEARAALPDVVPHRDAAFNAGRAALLTHALTAAPELLFAATEDRLHQGYRAAGMPETAALVAELRDRGVAAVVSGAGPSVLALIRPHEDVRVGIEWQAIELPIDVGGARIGSGRLGHAERTPVAAGRKS